MEKNSLEKLKNLMLKKYRKEISFRQLQKEFLKNDNERIEYIKSKCLYFFHFFHYMLSPTLFLYTLFFHHHFLKIPFVLVENLFVFYILSTSNFPIFQDYFFPFFIISFLKLISFIFWLNISNPFPSPKFRVIWFPSSLKSTFYTVHCILLLIIFPFFSFFITYFLIYFNKFV